MATPLTRVSGLGCISPAGVGVDALWKNIFEKTTNLRLDAKSRCVGALDYSLMDKLTLACSERGDLARIENLYPGHELFAGIVFGLTAARQAMEEAGWDDLGPDDGVIFASTTGEIQVWEQAMLDYFRDAKTFDHFANKFRHQPLALVMRQLMCGLGFSGRAHLVTSACAASTQAIYLANLWIKHGLVKRCLVGGVELLCELTLRGFDSFQLLANQPAKPFDQNRMGINLGEAAAFICLEAETHEHAGCCYISGGGLAIDAYHMTAPDPSGEGSARALQLALVSSGINAKDIGLVYAHGTGSTHNDAAEAAAVHKVFGDQIPVCSTKANHGHALAVSGVLESIIGVKALREQILIPTLNFESAGDDIRVNINKNIASASYRHLLKNTLGFGGVNASVVFSVGM